MNTEKSISHIQGLPHIVPVNAHLNEELLKDFKGEKDGFVKVGSKEWFLPKKYEKLGGDYKHFKVRSSDVWITGIPRSGTSVTQEIAWLLCNNLDYEAAKEDLDERVRYFELDLVFNDKTTKEREKCFPDDTELPRLSECIKNTLKFLDEDKKRRIMKTHFPLELLPEDILGKGCKVIYVCRYPKDVAVSYYFYDKGTWQSDFTGNFQKYWNLFKNGHCYFTPYFEHVKQVFDKKDLHNILFLFYEDFRKDPKLYILKLAEFLERPLTEEELSKLQDYVKFDNFKNNAAVSKPIKDADNNQSDFIRKGKVGGWKEHFTEEMSKEADEWIERNSKKIGIIWPNQK